MSERMAAKLLEFVYDDLSSLSRAVDDALQASRRVRDLVRQENNADEIDRLAVRLGELDVPDLAATMRELARGQRELPQLLDGGVTDILESVLGQIAERQAMIRAEGFAGTDS